MASPAPVTASNLARLSGGITGRARIGRHFDVLEKSGMAARAPLADRRVRVFQPTSALEALMGGWMRAMAAPAMAMALAGRTDVRLEAPAVVRRYLAQVVGCRAIGFNAFRRSGGRAADDPDRGAFAGVAPAGRAGRP
jgi:hypothetical protein